jgi:hypothetical protein
MHTSRSIETGRGAAISETVRLFVLPPLLSLAVVASSLMVFTTYLGQKSLETTYVVKSLQQSGVCAICHYGTYARAAFRLTSLR